MGHQVVAVADAVGIVFGACEVFVGLVGLEEAQHQPHQVDEGEAREAELANADADHTEFTKVVEAVAAEDVVKVVGGVDPVIDVITLAFKVVVERRIREKINVVAQRLHHRGVGVTKAPLGQSLHGSHVVGPAKPARLDQRRCGRILVQAPQATGHRTARQAARQLKHIAGVVGAACRQVGQVQEFLDVLG